MATSSITVTLAGTDLVYDNSVNVAPAGSSNSNSFDITNGAVTIYNGRNPEPAGTPRPAIKVTSIRVEPEWTANLLANQTHFMYNVYAIPFILTQGQPWRTTRRGPGVQNRIVFSANTGEEWELNAFSGTSQGVPNDRWYADPFVVHPYESLRIRLHDATTAGNAAAVWNSWDKDLSVLNVTIEYEDYEPDDRYYGRVSTNDIVYKEKPDHQPIPTTAETTRGYIELPLIDLYASSVLFNEAPFNRVTETDHFQLDELSFRSGYPFGGFQSTVGSLSATNYMYDLRIQHQTDPASDYNLRRFMSYTAGESTQLDYRTLLKEPFTLKKGQLLMARIYTTGFSAGSKLDDTNQYYYRQAPAFWFNGIVPK